MLRDKTERWFDRLIYRQCCDQGSRCRDRGQDRGSIPQDRGRGTRQLAYIINSAVFGGGSSPKILGGIALETRQCLEANEAVSRGTTSLCTG